MAEAYRQALNVTARLVLGGSFVYAGFLKSLDPASFALAIDSFGLLPTRLGNLTSVYLPWFEMFIGCALICGSWALRAALAYIVILLVAFTLALSSAWLRGLDPDCGCFGKGSSGVQMAILRDLLLLGVAGFVYRSSRQVAVDITKGSAPPTGTPLPAIAMFVLLAVLSGICVVFQEGRTSPTPPPHANHITASQENTPNRPNAPHVPAVAPRAPSVPAAFTGYATWAANDWREPLEACYSQPTIDVQHIDFFMQRLADAHISETARNIMAETLLRQDRYIPGLTEQLFAHIDDATQSSKWRDYAIQLVAISAAKDASCSAIEKRLYVIAEASKDTSCGTALLSLQRLERSKKIELGERFSQSVLTLAGSPDARPAGRITAIALIGSRKISAGLPLLRSLTRAPDIALRRTAIRALGEIGTADDDEAFQICMGDPNGLVAAAAKAGYVVLQQRMMTRR